MAWKFYDANGVESIAQLGTVAITAGGTGAITAAAAATALGVGTASSPAFVDLTLTDDLLLTSVGGVINFNNSNMTITHSNNTLTVAGGTFATAALTATTIQGTQVDITAQGDLRLQDSTGGQYVALQAAGTTTTHTLTFPAAVATTAGDMLTSSTSGVLSWTTPSAGVGLGLVIALGG